MNAIIDGFMPKYLAECNNEKEKHDIKAPSPVFVPLMYLERFSDWTDISKSVLQERIDQGSIPITVVGRHKMVDISQLSKLLLGRKEALD
jgi:hypothetical protein